VHSFCLSSGGCEQVATKMRRAQGRKSTARVVSTSTACPFTR
jgi:hypothetical protein